MRRSAGPILHELSCATISWLTLLVRTLHVLLGAEASRSILPVRAPGEVFLATCADDFDRGGSQHHSLFCARPPRKHISLQLVSGGQPFSRHNASILKSPRWITALQVSWPQGQPFALHHSKSSRFPSSPLRHILAPGLAIHPAPPHRLQRSRRGS